MKIRITEATDADIPALVSILTQATKYKVERGDMTWGNNAYTNKEVAHMLSRGGLYTVWLDDEIAATVTLQWADEPVWGKQTSEAGYLHRLAIKDGFHGQDLGQRIIEWAVSEVALKNRQFLRLDCDPANKQLCAYYEAQGFSQTGQKKIQIYRYIITTSLPSTSAKFKRALPQDLFCFLFSVF